jgi:hypothetical protein
MAAVVYANLARRDALATAKPVDWNFLRADAVETLL